MIQQEGRFPGADGVSLFFQTWQPEREARAHLAIVHGVAEHSGRYNRLVPKLLEAGCGVWGFDLRGHGRSPGKPGHIEAWTEYLKDLAEFLKRISERHPGTPIFVLGHSLGALIVLDFIESSPAGLAGAVVSGAPIEPAGVARPHLVAIARLLSRIWPPFALRLDIGGSALSRDPAQAAAYESDPLVHRVATARWGAECLAAVQRVKAHPDSIRLPVLFIHGENDPLNLASGTSAFFEHIAFEDKQLRVYPGSLHEPHNDLDAAQVADDLVSWIGAHLE